MEAFLPISLSLAEKEAFADYLRKRYNYSENTINHLLLCLTMKSARTQISESHKRWARRRYEEFKKLKGDENGV